MLNFYTRPFYFSDQLANYFRNANYGESGISDKINIILDRQIITWEVLDILFKVIIRINNLRGRFRYHYDENMITNLGGDSNIRRFLFGNDFTPRGVRIRGNLYVDDNKSGIQNVEDMSEKREFILERDTGAWGLLYESIPQLMFYYKISNYWVPEKMRSDLFNKDVISNLSDIHLFLKSIHLIYDQIQFLSGNNIRDSNGEILLETGIINNERILFTSENYQRLKIQLETSDLAIEHKCIILDDLLFQSTRYDYELSKFPEQKGDEYHKLKNEISEAQERYFELYDIVSNHFRPLDRRFRENVLVDVVVPIIQENDFFIPEVRTCSNSKTPVYWDETFDKENLIISYGKQDNYICYGLLELIDGFKPFGENNSFYDYRIYNSDGTFNCIPVEEATQLKELVKSLVSSLQGDNLTQASELISRIETVGEYVQGNTTYERNTILEFENFSEDVKDAIMLYLKKFFYTGMYMRQWKGPDYPFPMSENTTGVEQGFDADLHVRPHFENLVELLERVNELSQDARMFLHNLREVQHFNGKVRVSSEKSHNLDKLVEITILGNYCIRMGSTFFIGSGAYYSYLFKKHKFDGYNVENLDRIS